jgi:hypothetical protein
MRGCSRRRRNRAVTALCRVHLNPLAHEREVRIGPLGRLAVQPARVATRPGCASDEHAVIADFNTIGVHKIKHQTRRSQQVKSAGNKCVRSNAPTGRRTHCGGCARRRRRRTHPHIVTSVGADEKRGHWHARQGGAIHATICSSDTSASVRGVAAAAVACGATTAAAATAAALAVPTTIAAPSAAMPHSSASGCTGCRSTSTRAARAATAAASPSPTAAVATTVKFAPHATVQGWGEGENSNQTTNQIRTV